MIPGLAEAALRTVALGGVVAVASGALGLGLAWAVARTDLPGARTLAGLLSVPYALPAYLLGMAWVVLGNPTVGLLRDFLPPGGAYGFLGMAFVETCVAFAFPFLELRAGFERLDPALEEAARMGGASPARVFRDVSLPLLRPALVNGMCLSFLYTVAAFGVPAILGAPVRQQVLTTLIYSEIRIGGEAGLVRGLTLSAGLLVLAALAILVARLAGHRGAAAIGGARSSKPSLVALGAARWPLAGAAWGWILAAVALPWLALGMSALAPVAGKYDPALWTLKNLKYVLGLADFQEAILNSFALALGVASSVVIAGFLLAFAAERRGSRWASALIEASGATLAVPGTVLALVLVMVSASLTRLGLPADAPLALMALAFALKYFAVGGRSLRAAFRQVHPALEEAARLSGATTPRLLWTIWTPLLRKSLGAAWFLAALPMLTELTMSVLLTGPGAATLGTVLFQLQEYADQPSAAAMAWMLLTVALAVGFLSREGHPS